MKKMSLFKSISLGCMLILVFSMAACGIDKPSDYSGSVVKTKI